MLKLWVVVEMLNPDPYGSDSDLGLVPGGRVKLVKSATVDMASGPARDLFSSAGMFSSLRVHCLQFHPLHTNHIYIGTDTVSLRTVEPPNKGHIMSIVPYREVVLISEVNVHGEEPIGTSLYRGSPRVLYRRFFY